VRGNLVGLVGGHNLVDIVVEVGIEFGKETPVAVSSNTGFDWGLGRIKLVVVVVVVVVVLVPLISLCLIFDGHFFYFFFCFFCPCCRNNHRNNNTNNNNNRKIHNHRKDIRSSNHRNMLRRLEGKLGR